MRILITGGTGYIGSHTAVELLNSGYEVLIIDNLSNSNAEVVDKIEKITGIRPSFSKTDLCNKTELKEYFKKTKNIDAVIHFAAFKAVGESVQKPMMYYSNNISGMINLLEEMAENKIQNIVYSSSCTVYGEADTLPVTEESPVKKAESPYGFTKQAGEQMLFDISKAGDLHSVILRYFNPAGAHDSSLIGELPVGIPNNLVPYITQTAIGDRVLDKKSNEMTEVFNLGTGKGNSVMEVIRSFEKVSGTKLKYKIGPRREGDVVSIYSDTKKANEVLGWKAERDINDMMLTSWNWQKAISLKK